MALSKEEKEALAEHYKGKDQYDPSKAPEQEVATFMPKAYATGGMVAETDFSSMKDMLKMAPTHKGLAKGVKTSAEAADGYADGGDVQDAGDFNGPSLSADTNTVTNDGNPLTIPPNLTAALENRFSPPDIAPKLPAEVPVSPKAIPVSGPAVAPAAPTLDPAQELAFKSALGAPADAPAAAVAPAASGKLSPNEFDDLIKNLQPTRGQKIGQGAFSALAGLADAIETGVARAGSSNFQKNMQESAQQKRENLINAMKAKYETGFKGQELGQGQERIVEEARAHQVEEAQRAKDLAEQARAHTLEAGQRGDMLKFEQGKETREAGQAAAKDKVDAAQKIIEAYEKGSSINPFSTRPSDQEYNAAKNIIKSTGTAAGFAPGAPRVTSNGVKYTVNK